MRENAVSHALLVQMSHLLFLGVYKEVRFPSFCFSLIPTTLTTSFYSQPNTLLIMSLFSITPVYSSDAIKAIEERVDASSSKCVLYFLCPGYLLVCV